ncbi:hypothetical protein [Candidatus Magnetomonas plexicatena]|uniref:hypothetical protein n=1 Tax=Candidatus Magnetomonas plexicatena TaxID=2552947 RepID=UPI001100A257|nr:hypothetical protein E2O03_012605 [Nitrospirales bacterium LBB_01]
MELNDKETKFINRLIRRKIYFLIFSVSSSLMGVSLLIYHLINKNLNGPTFVLVVFILLSGRQNLRQYRISQLLAKVKPLIFVNNQEQ